MKCILGTRSFALALAFGTLATAAAVVPPVEIAQAQIGSGLFWCFQPNFSTPVGFAYCNASRTVEYWAYVVDEYQYSSMDNGAGNRWRLDVQAAPGSAPCSFTGFKDQVLALPEFQGKTIRFANHSISEETVVN